MTTPTRPTPTSNFLRLFGLTAILSVASIALANGQSPPNYSSGTINITKANYSTTTASGVIGTVTGTAVVNIQTPNLTVTINTLSGGQVNVGVQTSGVRSRVTIGSLRGGGLAVNQSGIVTVSAIASPITSLRVDGTATLPSAALSVTGAASFGANSVLNGGSLSAASFAVSGGTIRTVLTGTGALIKTGTSIATLTGANTFSGGTTISGGTLVVNSFGLVGSVTNNARLEFSQDSNGTFAGTISGTGQLIKSGTGRVGLTGANVYTGGTTINAGTLTVTTSSLPGAVVNNATLQFNQDGRGTFKGVISGTGAVLKSGLGAAGLTGVNTYTGGTTVDAGTLIVTTASLPGNVTNNAILQFNQSSKGTYFGVISGTGALVKTGTGSVGLTGANTYLGSTTISDGILLVTTSSLPGDSANPGSVVNNATLQFNQASSGTYFGVISGTGAVVKTGTGSTGLVAANTYTGGTTVSEGTLLVTTSSLPGNVVNNATLQFNQGSKGTYAGVISGTGAVLKTGAGAVGLTGANTYAGGTTISEGTLVVTSTSLPGDVVNNAIIQFNQNGNGTYASAITGTGSFLKTGTGNLGLTGLNNYSGGTTISDGTLFVTTSSLPTGSVVNNATLQFNQTATGVFNGTISGSGTVIKGGRGSMSFTADNAYTGTTELIGGTLFIEGNQGSASGNVNVASGATLGGTGTIGGNTTVATGGRHRIGSALGSDLTGQQTFVSSLAYQGGSTAFWRLNDNTTDTTDYDRAVVGTVLTVDPTAVFNLSFNTAGSTVVWADNFWSTEKLDTAGWLVYNAATLSVAGDIFALNPPSKWIDSTGVSLQAARPDYVFAFYQDSAEGNLYLNYIYSP